MQKLSGANLSEYRVFETEEFIKQLGKLPARDASLVRKKLSAIGYPQLREQPYFGKNIKKLRGYDPDTWRYRVGNYRLFYEIDEQESVIYIFTIDLRKDAY